MHENLDMKEDQFKIASDRSFGIVFNLLLKTLFDVLWEPESRRLQ
jgi:hypothetical protein